MTVVHFQVGDRVRVRLAAPHIQEGMVGTVQGVFPPTNTVYLVLFDDLPDVELATEAILEPEDRTPGPPTE